MGSTFYHIACDYSFADWDCLCDHLRDILWEDIFKLSTSAAVSEFCEWVQVGIDLYIPHCKYQIKPHTSPWFWAACAVPIVHGNHFFHLYQHKSSEAKVNFRQASNCCKRVLEAAKECQSVLQRSPSFLRNLVLRTFGKCLIVFSAKINLLFILYLMAQRCCFLLLIMQNCLLKTFSRILILMTWVSLYPSRTNLKLYNISITPKIVKKVIMALDLSKASGPDCIPVVLLKNYEPEVSYILVDLFNMCLKESYH